MTAAFNTFPTTTVTANAIASNIDGVTLTSMNSFGQAAVTFSGQNCGAKKPERIKKIITYCIIQSMLTGLIVAILELTFADPLISLYLDADAEGREIVAATAKSIMTVILTSYVIYGILDSASSCLKGLGYTFTSMMISLICICGIRMIWILGVFPKIGTLTSLLLAYPISWVLASISALVAFLIAFSRFKKRLKAEQGNVL